MKRERKASPRLRSKQRSGAAAARVKFLGEVARVLTHESRNVFGSLSTCLEILRRNPQTTAPDRELVDIMQSGVRRLSEIVDQFAAFGDPAPLRFESVSLRQIIDEVIERLRGDPRCAAGIEIDPHFDPAVGSAMADRGALANVFWHLSLNAAQAMGDRGRLVIEAARRGGAVEIHFRDSGPGVPRALREKIFEPLFTTKTRGTGLGLAIARALVRVHGGDLRLHRDGSAASCFAVRLPDRPFSAGDKSVNRRRQNRGGYAAPDKA